MNLLNIFRTPAQIKAREQKATIMNCRERIQDAKKYIAKWDDIPYSMLEDDILEILRLPKNKGCQNFSLNLVLRNDIDQLEEDLYLQQEFHKPTIHYAK